MSLFGQVERLDVTDVSLSLATCPPVGVTESMHCTITTCTDDPTELTTVDAWFVTWASQITHRSDNQGCGCCVDIWTVEASAEALAALPRHLWTETGPADG